MTNLRSLGLGVALLAVTLAACIEPPSSFTRPESLRFQVGEMEIGLLPLQGRWNAHADSAAIRSIPTWQGPLPAWPLELSSVEQGRMTVWFHSESSLPIAYEDDQTIHFLHGQGLPGLDFIAAFAGPWLAQHASDDGWTAVTLLDFDGAVGWVNADTMRFAIPITNSTWPGFAVFDYLFDAQGTLVEVRSDYLDSRADSLSASSAQSPLIIWLQPGKEFHWPVTAGSYRLWVPEAANFLRWPEWGAQDRNLLIDVIEAARAENENLDEWMALADDWSVTEAGRHVHDEPLDDLGPITTWSIRLARTNQTFAFIVDFREALVDNPFHKPVHVRSWAGDAQQLNPGYPAPNWPREAPDLAEMDTACQAAADAYGKEHVGLAWIDERSDPGQGGAVGGVEMTLGGGGGIAHAACWEEGGTPWLGWYGDSGALRWIRSNQ